MTAQNTDQVTIDVRDMTPRDRHPKIFGEFERLAVGQSMLLINDHDPKPLHYQFQAERPGEVGWEYIEEGPEVWQVRISKTDPN